VDAAVFIELPARVSKNVNGLWEKFRQLGEKKKEA